MASPLSACLSSLGYAVLVCTQVSSPLVAPSSRSVDCSWSLGLETPLAIVRDRRSDGTIDLLVGTPWNPKCDESQPAVSLLSGMKWRQIWIGHGPVEDDFGASVAAADLNGDGISEILVGCPQLSHARPEKHSEPRVIVYQGPKWEQQSEIRDPGKTSGFGLGMLRVGDLDGDKREEVVIWSMTSVYIFNGKLPQPLIALDIDGSILESVSLVGDLDGDAIRDLLIGTQAGIAGGYFRAISTARQTTLWVTPGDSNQDSAQGIGLFACASSDVDKDGIEDIAYVNPETNEVVTLSSKNGHALRSQSLTNTGCLATGAISSVVRQAEGHATRVICVLSKRRIDDSQVVLMVDGGDSCVKIDLKNLNDASAAPVARIAHLMNAGDLDGDGSDDILMMPSVKSCCDGLRRCGVALLAHDLKPNWIAK